MDDERPTFGSLFAGIGGIDLGLERAGWRGRWQVEYEPFCQRVLAKHWPDVTRYGDIHDVDWAGVERVDLVAGGFPCQPFSVAGKQLGLDDDRWLWPEFERCLRALRPRYVLVENVPGLLMGRGMDAVLGGLADLGYDTEWESIPAAAVGAPHLRYRVWIVAYDDRRYGRTSGPGEAEARAARHAVNGGSPDAAIRAPAYTDGDEYEGGSPPNGWPATTDLPPDADGSELWDEPVTVRGRGGQAIARHDGPDGTLADADGSGPQGRAVQPERADQRAAGPSGLGDADSASSDAYAAGRGPRSPVGEPGWWSSEPDVGRVAHGVPARVDRLRSLGNAVVPQVVEFIGRRILEAEGVNA